MTEKNNYEEDGQLFFFFYFFCGSDSLSIPYLTVANLVPLGK